MSSFEIQVEEDEGDENERTTQDNTNNKSLLEKSLHRIQVSFRGNNSYQYFEAESTSSAATTPIEVAEEPQVVPRIREERRARRRMAFIKFLTCCCKK